MGEHAKSVPRQFSKTYIRSAGRFGQRAWYTTCTPHWNSNVAGKLKCDWNFFAVCLEFSNVGGSDGGVPLCAGWCAGSSAQNIPFKILQRCLDFFFASPRFSGYSLSMETKRCSKCGETRAISQFAKSKTGKLGLARWCKQCFKQYNASRYKADPEKYHEAARRWQRDNWERFKELTANWRNSNELRRRQWIANNPDKIARYTRKAYYKDIEKSRRKSRITQQHRRARIRTTQVEQITMEIWDSILKFWQGLCAYCLLPHADLTMEHVIPLSRGGGHVVSNLVPACRKCNLSKGNKLVSEWKPRHKYRIPD